MSAAGGDPRPPRWAEALLALVLSRGLRRDSVLGDLAEEFARRAQRGSLERARRWYSRHAVGIVVRYALALPRGRHGSGGGTGVIECLAADTGQALRSLRHAPGHALLAAGVLAMGVGSTTSIFSVVDRILIRPLPYPNDAGLVVLKDEREGQFLAVLSEPEFHDLRREVASFSHVAAYVDGSPTLGSEGEPRRITVVRATSQLLPLLGLDPTLGRTYSDQEARPGSPEHVVVISHGLWLRAFGGDPGALGGTLLLENSPYRVVGIMPPGFAFGGPGVQAWVPLRLDEQSPWTRNNHYLRVIARLAPGVSLTGAQDELDALAARSTSAYPENYPTPVRFPAVPLRSDMVGDVRGPLVLLLGAVVFVLLVAAVNAAALFLARGEQRRAEIAVRSALGAGRVRLATQLLAESLVVAAAAGAAGASLSFLGVGLLRAGSPPGVPRLEEVAVDGRILALGLGVSLFTGLLFGLAPAIQAFRGDARDALTRAGWSGIGSRRAGRVRRTLVVAQLAMALVLTLGAGLLVRSLAELQDVELGFDPEGVLAVPLSPSVSVVAPDGDAIDFYRTLETRVAALPGVVAVGSALRLPLADGHDGYSIQVDGRPPATIGDAPVAGIQSVTPGYFDAMRIPLVAGRRFRPEEGVDDAPVAMVNERLARELWPGESAVGRRVRLFPEGSPWLEVVGVVADVKHYGVRSVASAKLYFPHRQGAAGGYYAPNQMTVLVRAEVDPVGLAAPIRAVVRELEPALPIGDVRPMERVVADALATDRFTVRLLTAFAVAALLLASVGVYGVTARSVTTRTRELGLRMAMGADRAVVATSVAREALLLVVVGVGAGILMSLPLANLLRALLFEVTPSDAATYLLGPPIVALAAVLASLSPALRAARLDPSEALREP